MFKPNVLHLEVSRDQRLFFVSDTHFGHKKLVHDCPDHFDCVRNYNTVDEMNNDIITQWRSVVSENDVVIFLGDLFMNCRVKDAVCAFYDYKQYLTGQIYWVYGNHDGVIRKKIKSFDFYDVADIRKHVVNGYSVRYIAQHHPFGEVPYYLESQFKLHGNTSGWVNNLVLVHGHTHLPTKNDSLEIANLGKVYENNVCWDAWYRPVQSVDLLFAKEVFVL